MSETSPLRTAPTANHDLSFDDWDEATSPRPETCDFDAVIDRAVSRRRFMGGVLGGLAAFGSAALLGGTTLVPTTAKAAGRLAFDAVPANTLDTITLPKGYSWQAVATWGDPLWSDAPDFDQASRGTAAAQAKAFGDNNDGMALFVDGDRTILVVNTGRFSW